MEVAIIRLVCVLCFGKAWKAVATFVVLVIVITTSVVVGIHTGDLVTTVCLVFHLVIRVKLDHAGVLCRARP